MRLPFPYRGEIPVAQELLGRLHGLDWTAVSTDARDWIERVRAARPSGWAMETLLREYPLSSAEGLALMRLAEALLRVPDAVTAMSLTADQLGRADFSGASESWLATLSSQAVGLSKKVLGEEGRKTGLFARMGAKAVVAATVRAVQLMGRQFVTGETLQEALQEAHRLRRTRADLRFSYDMLGEGARTDADALSYLASYRHAIAALAGRRSPKTPPEHADSVSIKLSAIHARYEAGQRTRAMRVLIPRVLELARAAATAGIGLSIDAEESERLELSLEIFEAVAQEMTAAEPHWRGLGLAVQAYQTRALPLIEAIARMARALDTRFMIRLVKGAYWDYEVKRAQELGLPGFAVFTHKHHTDLCYLACSQAMLAAPDAIYPQFASHNAATLAAVLAMALPTRLPFELQRLHGMGEAVHRELHSQYPEVPLRIYAPVGLHRDLLAYLVRRLLENGANSSFVHRLGDPDTPIAELLRSPLRVAAASGVTLPCDILPGRRNTAGTDLACETMAATVLAAYADTRVESPPPTVMPDIEPLVQRLARGQRDWNARPIGDRALILEKAADTLERDLPQWCARIVREGRRSWSDAVAEVREAADYCRYYAQQARELLPPRLLPGITGERNSYALRGRGVWACISPWNFPLAIFTGQVAAALVTGNAVAAKPAEQTPGIAAKLIALLHDCGVPPNVLQGVYGAGATGAALVAQPAIAGVAFTGSTTVARSIARQLAAKSGPIVPLIAETGGINAMIVDSTALPEQVVDAVLQSCFRSAGQRCSALRLLCVQEDIADGLLNMLGGAIALLELGDPADLASDLGPVIDDAAYATLQRQIATLESQARLIARASLPADAPANSIAPVAFEIASLEQIGEEIFGPVLQVLRWHGDVQTLVERIGALHYGLTLGVQTRIDTRAQAIATTAHVGNVYVNRNMIGAVVGVQPFGGEGLSGTGPKAGGPQYLPRFCSEYCISINTTAAGGDVDLLMAAQD
ncbi:MAG: L-glutamate gamma-semialdehyde dehydrogenase [Steroidobacteraceae bacterium]|nr:L-glutamate gamma-semialdehyde dehydrogenase [Nevskiaceae bacterium]MCP5359735.1 L-glutamate gamma-semialdehyde dehydrogenase [Nevskiaceae bacterium]MCP5472775.1 L-glutamate gamma-semialdehyde dehydrogenase [Nevskiaceae bacterium]